MYIPVCYSNDFIVFTQFLKYNSNVILLIQVNKTFLELKNMCKVVLARDEKNKTTF